LLTADGVFPVVGCQEGEICLFWAILLLIGIILSYSRRQFQVKLCEGFLEHTLYM